MIIYRNVRVYSFVSVSLTLLIATIICPCVFLYFIVFVLIVSFYIPIIVFGLAMSRFCFCTLGQTYQEWNGYPIWDKNQKVWFTFRCPHIMASTPAGGVDGPNHFYVHPAREKFKDFNKWAAINQMNVIDTQSGNMNWQKISCLSKDKSNGKNKDEDACFDFLTPKTKKQKH